MEKLMNKENEWDHQIAGTIKEGPADCIRMDEVAAALKKMKRQSPRLVRASSRNDTIHRDIGTQWILDFCNGTAKEGCTPEKRKYGITNLQRERDPMECGSYRGIKLLEHAMKVVERTFKNRFWQQIDIDDMQFGFMKGKGTTDAILNTSLSTRIASRVLMLLNIRPSHLSVRTRELWHNG